MEPASRVKTTCINRSQKGDEVIGKMNSPHPVKWLSLVHASFSLLSPQNFLLQSAVVSHPSNTNPRYGALTSSGIQSETPWVVACFLA
jgi:hypothetical protein